MATQRIPHIDPDTLAEEPRQLFDRWCGNRAPLNIFLTYFYNAELNQNWAVMAGHLFFENSLSNRQREIIVLRATWICGSDYEFVRHINVVRRDKLLNEDEVHDLTMSDLRCAWSDEERALVKAVDELLQDHKVGDDSWEVLSRSLNEHQLLDVLVTAGGYTLNSMATNSFGVALESDITAEHGLTPSDVRKKEHAAMSVSKTTAIESLKENARLAPLSLSQLDSETKEFIEPRYEAADTKNILMTLARYPDLLKSWMPITRYVFNESALAFPDIELICLRTTWLCQADYEFTHHAIIALTRGLNSDQVNNIPRGSTADCYCAQQKLLLDGVDQLVTGKNINDELWLALSDHYDSKQLMDIVFTCGNYFMISLVQKSLCIELEDATPLHQAFRG